jgi:putative transposase
VLALVPRISARGNRQCRLSPEQIDKLRLVIQTKWKQSEARNFKSCHRELEILCLDAGVTCPSYPTMIAWIKAQETERDLRTRHGKRMAYQMGEFISVLHADTPVHGSRPMQYVHIDHTQIDIELVSSRSGRKLGRPWLTIAVDAWSRRIVAFYLTFDPPSYHSVMMAVRDMVKRFNRLPEFIVTDNGRDFASTAFESFLQALGVHLRFRPAGQPRHGAVLERLFGRLHSEYIHNLRGNTKATKNVRMVTGKHLPVNFAEWSLTHLYYGIEHWATQYYDDMHHATLDCSPRQAWQRGLAQNGRRAHKHILFNRDFLIQTCPPADRQGTRMVDGQRGVKVNHLLYWHPDFRLPHIAGQSLLVRYDPWDISSVYVWAKNRWLHATCRALVALGQFTELDRRALTREYLRRSVRQVETEHATQRLREFIRIFTPEGAMAVDFDRQQENKDLYNLLGQSNISPILPPKRFNLTDDEPDSVAKAETWSSVTPVPPPTTTVPEQLPEFELF